MEITGTRVAIVTDMAIPAEHIDEAKAEEARAARGGPPSGEDLRRGSRHRQRVARAIARATACQETSQNVSTLVWFPRRIVRALLFAALLVSASGVAASQAGRQLPRRAAGSRTRGSRG